MFSKYKKGDKVMVCGPGQNDGRFYRDVPAIIIQRDPYFHDYNVRFKDGTEDWILPEHLRKPCTWKGRKNI